MIKKIINRVLLLLSPPTRVNIVKTLLINILTLPLKEALKFPVIILGPCKIYCTNGQIIFSTPIKRGMLIIGSSDPFRSSFSKSFISIQGKLNIEEQVILRRGISLYIRPNAVLEIQKNTSIGHNCSIYCSDHISIGSSTSIGNNTTIMDTDFHYIINIKTRVVKNNHSAIIIGENNWIGSWCTIKKGVQTPKGTIVAGPYSMMDKNYIGRIPEYSIIAGSPAKLLVEGMRRVNNLRSELHIFNYYFSKDNSSYHLAPVVDIDKFCMPN